MKIATVCSGIGSPEQALKNLNIPHEIVFACEIDKYARASYNAIHSAGVMYEDMTKEEWDKPEQYSDLIVGGIPCQSFSLAGKRLGELDPRGLLFFDFYRYVKNQQPKYFIIENVKGLLSDAGGKTFQNWLQLLGRSVNTQEMMFKHSDSLGYNLHHTVLNSKNFGVPQNRERVFIVGIRSDLPNTFRFPIGWKLDKRLKDVLETDVDEKYYLSEKMLYYLEVRKERYAEPNFRDLEGFASCITVGGEGKSGSDMNLIKVKEPTKQGYAEAVIGDSINLSNPNSETRRGRVGKQIANTLDTSCNQAVVEPQIIGYTRDAKGKVTDRHLKDIAVTIHTSSGSGGNTDQFVKEPKLIQVAQLNCFESEGRIYDINGLSRTIKDGGGGGAKTGWYQNENRIRRLTPLETWRLQSFPDEAFYKAKAVNSDTQLYKQAGNSITVSVMEAIIKNLI